MRVSTHRAPLTHVTHMLYCIWAGLLKRELPPPRLFLPNCSPGTAWALCRYTTVYIYYLVFLTPYNTTPRGSSPLGTLLSPLLLDGWPQNSPLYSTLLLHHVLTFSIVPLLRSRDIPCSNTPLIFSFWQFHWQWRRCNAQIMDSRDHIIPCGTSGPLGKFQVLQVLYPSGDPAEFRYGPRIHRSHPSVPDGAS